MRAWLLCAVLCVGCGELEGASAYTESPAADAALGVEASGETSTPGQNDLDGYYVDDIVPSTRALFRLDRASDPKHPWIVFVSSADPVTLPCELFKASGWNGKLPAGVMVHVLSPGTDATGSFVVRPADPPALDGAWVGRAYASSSALNLERAVDGTLTISRADLSGSRGSFDVQFSVLYEDDPEPYPQRVRGSFDAPACAVEW